MTLTCKGCPMSAESYCEVNGRLRAMEGITQADVDIVWEPEWNATMMSEAAKEKLGF